MWSRSSPKRSAPVTFSTPSVRAMRAPTAWPTAGSAAAASEPAAAPRDRLEDRRVAGAPAQHAAEAVEHLGVGRGRGSRDEVVGRHQHPRRARAALRAAAREEGGLERGEAVGRAQALDRLDAPALRLAGGDEARAHLLAVEPDRARAAVAGVAADLGPGEPEVLAQDVDQATAPVGLDLDRRGR